MTERGKNAALPEPLKGGCACGSIRYEVAALPRTSLLCCCRDCQYAGGSGHMAVFIVPAESVTLHGELTYYDRAADSGNTVSRGFCGRCGAQVMARNSGYPESRFIAAASLDDPSIFQPEFLVSHTLRQPWDHVDPRLLKPE